MKMKKRMVANFLAIALILVGSAFFLTGCAEDDDDTIRIGVSLAFADEFNMNLEREYEVQVVNFEGVEIVFANANGSSAQQLIDIENLIAQQVDVIVLRAVEADAIETAAQAIINAGIILVVDETDSPGGLHHARIVGEQIDHGIMLGQYLQGLLDRGEISEINIGYIAGSPSAFALGRKNGITISAPTANFVAGGDEGFVLAEGWNAVLAQEIVEGWISGGLIHEMNVIAAMNDEIANGVIAALAGNFPDIIILGVDGSAIGQHNIREGHQRATTFQDISLLVRAVLNTSVALAQDEAIVFDDVENRLVNPRHLSLMTIDTIDDLVN